MIKYIFYVRKLTSKWLSVKMLDYHQNILIHTDTYREYMTRANSAKKEPEMIEWIEKCAKKYSTMYDIGANVGAYSLVAAQNGLKVCAFEPAYQNYYQCQRNITLNNFDDKIRLFPVAFSTDTKLAEFNYIDATTGSSRGYYNEEGLFHLDEAVTIRKATMVFSLDSFVETFLLPLPQMLKIDVDGGEFDILKGSSAVLSSETLKELIIEIDDVFHSSENYRIPKSIRF